jgi:hypothetical protein
LNEAVEFSKNEMKRSFVCHLLQVFVLKRCA